MTVFSMREAAELLGVSDDTVRRWADPGGSPPPRRGPGRDRGTSWPRPPRRWPTTPDPGAVKQSARNRMRGIVTRVVRDTVMAQVEMQAGPFRIVSLMSREAADDLGLEPGVGRRGREVHQRRRRDPGGLVEALPAAVVRVLALTGSPAAGAAGPTRPAGRATGRRGLGMTVLAASSLTEAFGALGQASKAHPGTRVIQLRRQLEPATRITAGAPADVFASASPSTMDQVVMPGTPRASRRSSSATGWRSPSRPATRRVTGLADFADGPEDRAVRAGGACGAAAAARFAAPGSRRPDTLEPTSRRRWPRSRSARWTRRSSTAPT